MIGNGIKKTHGKYRLSEPVELSCETADTFYKIPGTYIDGEACGFEIEDNKLVYKGASGRCFLLNGTSDLAVDKVCEISYIMVLNGELVPATITPHTFTAPAKTSNISVTGILKLNNGDTIETYAKASDDNIALTVKTLTVTLWS